MIYRVISNPDSIKPPSFHEVISVYVDPVIPEHMLCQINIFYTFYSLYI
jgi:hypothetical protein